jgi:hypothetical protein
MAVSKQGLVYVLPCKTGILIPQNRYKLFQILFHFGLLLKGANIKIYKTTNLQLNGGHPVVPKEYI